MTESTVSRKRERNTDGKGADVLFTAGELKQSRPQRLVQRLASV